MKENSSIEWAREIYISQAQDLNASYLFVLGHESYHYILIKYVYSLSPLAYHFHIQLGEELVKRFLKDYCESLSLNSIEASVISAISEGVITKSELATKLSFDSILIEATIASLFKKCSVTSFGQLFSQMLDFSISKQQTCMGFHRRPSVMIVDDEPELCELIKDNLELRGVRCYCYTNPVMAHKNYPYHKVDAIVTDFRMPVLNGLEFIQSIRESYKILPPVIMMTSQCPDDLIYELYDIGTYAILHKPYDEDKLFETILQTHYDPPPTHEHFEQKSKIPHLRFVREKNMYVPQVGRGGIQLSAKYLGENKNLTISYLQKEISLELDLKVNQSNSVFRSFGEIAWRDSSAGLAIKFTKTSEHDLNLLRDYISEHQISSFIPKPQRDSSVEYSS